MSDDLQKKLTESDKEFIRVLEDLIDTLIERGVILLTDLPAEALEKIQQRKQTRSKLQEGSSLLDDEDEGLPL